MHQQPQWWKPRPLLHAPTASVVEAPPTAASTSTRAQPLLVKLNTATTQSSLDWLLSSSEHHDASGVKLVDLWEDVSHTLTP